MRKSLLIYLILACYQLSFAASITAPRDSTITQKINPPKDTLSPNEIRKLKSNTIEGEIGVGHIGVGVIIIGLGQINPALILILGLVCIGIAFLTLLMYLSFKKNFNLKMPKNIIAAFFYVIIGIIILASLLAIAFLGLALGLALLIGALLSIVIPTKTIGLGFIVLGLAYLLFKHIRYLIRRHKAKKYGIIK